MSSVNSSYIFVLIIFLVSNTMQTPVLLYRNSNGADQRLICAFVCYLLRNSSCNAVFYASHISRFCLASVAGKYRLHVSYPLQPPPPPDRFPHFDAYIIHLLSLYQNVEQLKTTSRIHR